jgi:hypothetical protein
MTEELCFVLYQFKEKKCPKSGIHLHPFFSRLLQHLQPLSLIQINGLAAGKACSA